MSIELNTPDLHDPVSQDFCNSAINTMIGFYGVTKTNFEEMSQDGYTEIRFGRGPLGFFDRKTGHYIVSFAAFFKKDSPEIKTLEVKKKGDYFGSVSLGLSVGSYSPDEYQKVIDKFRLVLVSEDLAVFLQRFN